MNRILIVELVSESNLEAVFTLKPFYVNGYAERKLMKNKEINGCFQ